MTTERAIMIVDNKQLCILTHGVPTISLLCRSEDVNQISHQKVANTSTINQIWKNLLRLTPLNAGKYAFGTYSNYIVTSYADTFVQPILRVYYKFFNIIITSTKYKNSIRLVNSNMNNIINIINL